MNVQTIAYVASTLPIAVLDKKIAEWGVTQIVLQGNTHLASYVYLQQRHPSLVLKVLSASLAISAIQLLGTLSLLKATGRRLIFFHECCCPVFDVLVTLFRPNGDYYPQVTLDSFLPIEPHEVVLSKQQKVFRVIGLENWFRYYRGDMDSNAGYFYVQSLKTYPPSITKHAIGESSAVLLGARVKAAGRERKILLLCGRDIADVSELKKIYSQVIEQATSLGFLCYLKDHPAQNARLNLVHKNASSIDPAQPAELIVDDFTFVMGVASTGLLHFGSRAVSIIKLLPTGDDGASARRIAHLRSLAGGEEVQFPVDLEAFTHILKNTSHIKSDTRA